MKLKEMIDIYGFESIDIIDSGENTIYSLTSDIERTISYNIRQSVPERILEKEVDFCVFESGEFYYTFNIYLK